MTAPRPIGPAAGEAPQSFNEIQFLSWNEFRRMAPAIAGLEAARLARLISRLPVDHPLHNALVKARFEVGRFLEMLKTEECEEAVPALALPLGAALLSLALRQGSADDETEAALHYVVDRLQYLHDRISLIY